eukprot:TRINITY_DN5486_c2_g1_i1.p1 TRINITY_DN5486_c2_g1~~TRINITY_DN5486_c2_g1_i1.p1  ORF type:complete len:228 (+),score=62.98 TRINITY_DN5486_c2_g1_i1:108-791(+)
MAVTLKFLSRAQCTQQLIGASPKVLGAATPKSLRGALTPKTPPVTPKTPFTPSKSPFFYSCSSPSLADVDTTATVSAKQAPDEGNKLLRAALQSANSARQHFLTKSAARAKARADETQEDAPMPTLLARRLRPRSERRLRFADADADADGDANTQDAEMNVAQAQFPVLLGKAPPDVAQAASSSQVQHPEFSASGAADEALSAAERARQCFLARREVVKSRFRAQVP